MTQTSVAECAQCHRRPLLNVKHCKATPLLPLQNEESETPDAHLVLLLPRHHWKHPDQLHHCEVWKLHCLQLQDPAECCKYSRKDDWWLTPLPPGNLQLLPILQSSQHCWRLHPPPHIFFSLLPYRGNTGARVCVCVGFFKVYVLLCVCFFPKLITELTNEIWQPQTLVSFRGF